MVIKSMLKHVFVIVLVVCIVFPIAWMFSTALKRPEEVFSPALIPSNPTLENFDKVLGEHPFMRWLSNSLVIACGIVSIRILTSILAAYGFSFFEFRGQNILFLVVIGTMMIPFAITMIPNYITISSMGLLNTHLGVIIPYIASGFGVFFFRQYMKSIPKSLVEAATIDGANSWQILWTIIVPLIRGSISALIVWFGIEAWNLFFWPMLILTDQSTRTLPIAMLHFQDQESGMLWGELMALATLISLPTLLMYLIARRKIMETSITSGLKG